MDRTIELQPDFMILAGDIFQHARPSNRTLENAIANLRRLKDAGIPVLTVDGSHDSAPNLITGTILDPLDSAGLIHHLPRHKGASWQNESCYVYGIPNFRTQRTTAEHLPRFMEKNEPTPDPSRFNVFVFHMALDIPKVRPPQMEAEASLDMIPDGFDYYAGGHIHKTYKLPMKGGILVYSGCTETVDYEDAEVEKGFYHIEVDGKGKPTLSRIKLETPRHFVVLDRDYTGLTPARITETAVRLVEEADETGAVIIPVLKGALPAEASRGEIDLAKIRDAAKEALLVRPILKLRETAIPEEVIRSIFAGELKDLKTKAFEYFFEIFSERRSKEEAEELAKLAVNLIEPLVKKDETKIKEELEASPRES